MQSAYNKFNSKAAIEIKHQRVQNTFPQSDAAQSQQRKKQKRNPTATAQLNQYTVN